MTKVPRLTRDRTALLVVDVQERLLPSIADAGRALGNVVRLVQGAGVLKVPVHVTEQYRKGLGQTVPEIAGAIPDFDPIEKLAFSACGAAGLVDRLMAGAPRAVLLCGIETHVCVTQTCLDLREEGFEVFVATDAVSSRTRENHEVGLDRMREAGATIVSTEMALFELLGAAGTEEFKQILPLVK
jgi:nicotinamidase-related amidase